jgi:predicted  nucleic acid-binding Zn-ribbon protein
MSIFRTLFTRSSIDRSIRNAFEDVLDSHAGRIRDEMGALGTIQDLRRERDRLADRIREMSKELEDLGEKHQREEREVKHKLGLEVLRQEQEERLRSKELGQERAELERQRELILREAKVGAREEAFEESKKILNDQLGRLERIVDSLAGAGE